jgi:hypothetical protein
MEVFFGKSIAFNLRGILVEKFGSNLRNEMAHGLAHAGSFYSPESVYLWWLALHLAFFGKNSTLEKPKDP